MVFQSGDEGKDNVDIYRVSIDGSNLKKLTDNPRDDVTPSWFANQILYSCNTGASLDICSMDTEGNNRVVISNNGNNEASPFASPDGEWIVFEMDISGNKEIFVMYKDGSQLTRLTNNSAEDWSPSWIPYK